MSYTVLVKSYLLITITITIIILIFLLIASTLFGDRNVGPTKIKNNSRTTIIVDPFDPTVQKNSGIVEFDTKSGVLLFSKTINGIDGIVLTTTGHIPDHALGFDKNTGNCFIIINANKMLTNPDTNDAWSLKELQNVRAVMAKESNIFKQWTFKYFSGDKEEILNKINQIKTYADDFNYYTPKLKHDKNFNISLVIRRSI